MLIIGVGKRATRSCVSNHS